MPNERDPVLFEFPLGSGHMWDSSKHLTFLNDYAYERYEDYKVNITLCADGQPDVNYSFTRYSKPSYFSDENEAQKAIEYQRHAAIFKAEGWLSPEDQRPFCMESARKYVSDE